MADRKNRRGDEPITMVSPRGRATDRYPARLSIVARARVLPTQGPEIRLQFAPLCLSTTLAAEQLHYYVTVWGVQIRLLDRPSQSVLPILTLNGESRPAQLGHATARQAGQTQPHTSTPTKAEEEPSYAREPIVLIAEVSRLGREDGQIVR